VVNDTRQIVVPANTTLILHGHHYFKGPAISPAFIVLAGVGSSVMCENQPSFQDPSSILSSWQGTCGIDVDPESGAMAAIEVQQPGFRIENLSVRGNRRVTSLIHAKDGVNTQHGIIRRNVLRGIYYDNHPSGYAVDFDQPTRGVGDELLAEGNEIYWTAGGFRINPGNSSGAIRIVGNEYYLGYGPALTMGPNYTFDAHIENNVCAFIQVSSANEIFWDLRNSDSFLFANNHDECHDFSGAGGVSQVRVTAQNSGAIIANTLNGNTTDLSAAHDPAYNINLQGTRNIVIEGNLLKNSHIAGIHFGANVSAISYSGNYYSEGHDSSGSETEGLPSPVYGARPAQTGNATSNPGGWADTCSACGAGTAGTANKLWLIGRYLPAISFSQICTNIAAADSATNSDLCLYNGAGTLVANAGARHLDATGVQCFAPVQPVSIILPSGLYFYGWTSAGSALKINLDTTSNKEPLAYSVSSAHETSSGGVCPASIKPPGRSVTPIGTQFGLF
jgi:hypothetical protein